MNDIQVKLWNLIKTTLIEKDDSNPVYGSIKRWGAWILFFYAGFVIFAGLVPSGQLHIGEWLKLAWHHQPIDRGTLRILVEAIGTYILTGQALTQITATIQHRNGLKYPTPPESPVNPTPTA